MTEPIKNCGSCRWWEKGNFLNAKCGCPIPKSANVSDTDYMFAEDGTDCPCHAYKVPQEVLEAAKYYRKAIDGSDREAYILANYAIEHLQPKGEQ